MPLSPKISTPAQQPGKRFISRILVIITIVIGSPVFAQPVINSFSPSAAPVGATVTISGNNFSSTAANNIVYFGAVRATVSAATATTLTVRVPMNATCDYITVTCNKLTAFSHQAFTLISGNPLTFNSFNQVRRFSVTGYTVASLAVGDLDGDGKPDLVSANFDSHDISVFRNTSVIGTVQMQPEQKWKTGDFPDGLAMGDLNGDGKPDLAVASINGHVISVYINTSSVGGISFANRIDIPQGNYGGAGGVAINDVDKDGKPDLITADANRNTDPATNTSYGTISVYRNTSVAGSLSFAAPVWFKTNEHPRRMCVGDIDGDGKPDVAVTNHVTLSAAVLRNTSTPGVISFAGKQDYPTGSYPQRLVLGDLTGDGKPELAVSNFASSTVSVFKNTSISGSISFAPKQDLSVNSSQGVDIGDVTGDGKPDLVASALSYVSIFQNTSSGGNLSFSAKMDFYSGNESIQPAIGDIDGDGLPDITIITAGEHAISVLKLAGPPIIDLGDDVTLCQGDSLELKLAIPNAQYLWSTGTTQNSLVIKQTGPYWVKVTTPYGTSTSNTIQVTFNAPPVVDLGRDTVLCEREKLILRPAVAASSYLWQNGTLADSLVVTQAGTYWVQVKQDVCTVADTINVNYKPLPYLDLGDDTAICKGSTIVLNAYSANAAYLWSNGSNTADINVNDAGTYWLALTENGCTANDSILVSYIVLPFSPLGNDTSLCNGHDLLLEPKVKNASFLWPDGSTGPSFKVTQPGTYKVTITNQCETGSDEITVQRRLCELFMPNAFTPNRDGVNDVFRIKDPSFIKKFDMQIFNRWGQLVFSSKDAYKGWSGYSNGTRQPAGNYVWSILLTDIFCNTNRFKGFVLLVD